MMAVRVTGRGRILVARTRASGVSRSAAHLRPAPGHAGRRSSATMPESGAARSGRSGAQDRRPDRAVIIQSPNFFGIVEQREGRRGDRAPPRRAAGRSCSPKPSRWDCWSRPRDADIVAGELQSFAISPELRRPLRRHHRHQGKVHAPDARPPGGRDQGFARQSRLLPDARHARAAHPPREGDLQHLHQPGADRADGDGLHDASTASRDCANWPSRIWPRRTTWRAS